VQKEQQPQQQTSQQQTEEQKPFTQTLTFVVQGSLQLSIYPVKRVIPLLRLLLLYSPTMQHYTPTIQDATSQNLDPISTSWLLGNCPSIQPMEVQYLGLGDLTPYDVVLSHTGRDTCGQKFWRQHRGPCRVLTEPEAINLLVQFQKPLLLKGNTVEDQPSSAHAAYSASASAASLYPRKMMTQIFTTTPRVLAMGKIDEIGRKKSKGVFRFATPQDVIHDVKNHRSPTDPHAKKRSSPISSTKRARKDPPSPQPSDKILNEPYHHHRGDWATEADEYSTTDLLNYLEQLPVHSFQDDDDDDDDPPQGTETESLCDFLDRYQSALHQWERTTDATSGSRNNFIQCRGMMEEMRTVLRVYTLLPGVDVLPCYYSSIQCHASRSARQTIVAMWKDLCQKLSVESTGEVSSSYSSGRDDGSNNNPAGSTNNPNGNGDHNNHRNYGHSSNDPSSGGSGQSDSYYNNGSHTTYSNDTQSHWRGSCASNPHVDTVVETKSLLSAYTKADTIHRESQDKSHQSDKDETVDPEENDNSDRESESSSSSSSSHSESTNESSQDIIPRSSTSTSSFYKVNTKEYYDKVFTSTAHGQTRSETVATTSDYDLDKDKAAEADASMVATTPAPATKRHGSEWVENEKEHVDPSVELLGEMLETLVLQNLDVKSVASTRTDDSRAQVSARDEASKPWSSWSNGGSFDATDPHYDTKELVRAIYEGSEFQSDPTMFVEMVLGLMRNSNIDDKEVQSYCMSQMREASKKNPNCASALVNAQAPHDVLLAMKNFPNDTSIQTTGCVVLWRWCEVPHAREALISAGACTQVLETLRTCIQDHQEQISAYAVCALASLSKHAQGRKSLNEMEATQTVVQVMGCHLSSRPIQKYGCTFLSNCAKDKDRKLIASLKVVPEVNAVVQSILNHSSMLELGCSILRKYMEKSMNLLYLEECAGYDRLFSALQSHSSEVPDAQWIVKQLPGIKKKGTTVSAVSSDASKSKLVLAPARALGEEDGAPISMEQEIARRSPLG
jgi:hypothetical protein